jgi:hypothetical protein
MRPSSLLAHTSEAGHNVCPVRRIAGRLDRLKIITNTEHERCPKWIR